MLYISTLCGLLAFFGSLVQVNYDILNGIFYVESHRPWLKELFSLSSVVGTLCVFQVVASALAGVLLMLVPWFMTKGDGVALSAPLMAVGVINGVRLGETIQIGQILYWLGIPIGTFSALVSLYDNRDWATFTEIMKLK